LKDAIISIIIPVYNGAAFLERCLDAVLTQDFEDYEVICIDDGSTDETYSILKSRKEPNIRIIKQENAGVWNARMRGLSEARGDYIAFCDCDDKPAANWISKMHKQAVFWNADITVCGFRRVDSESGHTISKEMMLSGSIDVSDNKLQLVFLNTSLWNKLFKAELLNSLFLPEQPPRLAEDSLLLTGIYPDVNKVAFVPEVLYDYYLHSASAISHVTINDFIVTRDAFSELSRVYPQKYYNLYTCMAVMHCAVSFSFFSRKNTAEVIRETYNFITGTFPNWKNAITLRDIIKSRYRWKMTRVYSIFLLYRLHLFDSFVSVWQFMSDKFGIKLKW